MWLVGRLVPSPLIYWFDVLQAGQGAVVGGKGVLEGILTLHTPGEGIREQRDWSRSDILE